MTVFSLWPWETAQMCLQSVFQFQLIRFQNHALIIVIPHVRDHLSHRLIEREQEADDLSSDRCKSGRFAFVRALEISQIHRWRMRAFLCGIEKASAPLGASRPCATEITSHRHSTLALQSLNIKLCMKPGTHIAQSLPSSATR